METNDESSVESNEEILVVDRYGHKIEVGSVIEIGGNEYKVEELISKDIVATDKYTKKFQCITIYAPMSTLVRDVPTHKIMSKSQTGALKETEGKPRFDLIPVGPLTALAELYAKGAEKYEDRNWEKQMEFSKHYSSALNHLTKFWGGENSDEEMGSLHVINAAWHMFALAEYLLKNAKFDDRPK